MTQAGLKNLFNVMAVFFGVAASPLFAQNGQIQGTVLDPAGAAIPGARVQATDTAKGVVVKEGVSGADGEFTLQPLGAGTYSLQIESSGMKKSERTGITLDVN